LDSLGIQTEYGTVKLTFQKFYRVTGSSTQKKGVESDVVLPDEYELLKYREKDNPAALNWDVTQKAKFQPWVSNINIDKVVLGAKQHIAADTSTTKFTNNLKWIYAQMEKPVYLKLDKYIQYKKQLQSIVQQNENILKLKDPMAVTALKADHDKFYANPDKPKQDRYQAWLKMVAKDNQIAESIKILNAFKPVSIGAVKK